MLKRIVMLVLLVTFLSLVGSQESHAEAADHYLGAYADGKEAYLKEDTVRVYQITRNGYLDSERVDCIVKAVNPSSDVWDSVSYEITYGQMGAFIKRNDVKLYDRHTRKTFLESNPVEKNLLSYIPTLLKLQGKARRDGFIH